MVSVSHLYIKRVCIFFLFPICNIVLFTLNTVGYCTGIFGDVICVSGFGLGLQTLAQIPDQGQQLCISTMLSRAVASLPDQKLYAAIYWNLRRCSPRTF